MFTGIIEDLGKITSLIRYKDRTVLAVSSRFIKELKVGDSVCVNGVCLTVTELLNDSFKVDVVGETLQRSDLTFSRVGDVVNLERALASNGRFDGHIVTGHVDAIGIITNSNFNEGAKEIEIKVPGGYEKYVAEKGSIAVDGISLTVASVNREIFKVAVIPHTLIMTNLTKKKIGDRVNLEFDVLAKYVEKMLLAGKPSDMKKINNMTIDDEFLKQAGFLN